MSKPPSRYRSQRRANATLDQDPAPAVPTTVAGTPRAQPDQDHDGSVLRSKSRYHKKADPGPSASSPPEAEGYDGLRARRSSPPQAVPGADHGPTPNATRRHGALSGDADGYGTSSAVRPMRDDDPRSPSDAPVLDRVGLQPQSPAATSPLKPSQAPTQSHPTSTADLWPPPKPEPARTRDGPPTSSQITATETSITQPRYQFEKEAGRSCFGIFKRKRGQTSSSDPQKAVPIARPLSGHAERNIIAGGAIGGAVPGTDAPVSAINAGERQVVIECGRSKITLPVTPATTAVDLIESASVGVSERIDPKSAVLLEQFGTVGVQRPLRRYERVRDVINSWDSDQQNTLLLLDPGTGSSEEELSLAGAPAQRPGDDSWLMHYSQRPGKWDRRLIHLREDGQVLMQKDPNKPKDLQNLCHLSDFDIYTPERQKVRNKIKPPKPYCFAIKSQQKTAMFESTADFVHFFCVGDKLTADSFYAAAQGWRSWYLVHVMGEGSADPPTLASQVAIEAREAEALSGGDRRGGHRKGQLAEGHYHSGSSRPLIDSDIITERPTTSKSAKKFSGTSDQLERPQSAERRVASGQRKRSSGANKPLLAEDEPLAHLARARSVNDRKHSMDRRMSPLQPEFAETGLLGRSYSQRRRDEEPAARPSMDGAPSPGRDRARRNVARNAHQPISPADGVAGVQRNKSVKGANTSHERSAPNDLQRSRSTKQKQEPAWGQPLVDLTPQYREPPQHIRKGQGHKPDHIGPGGLIDSATSPEDPLGIPPSTDWRGRNAHGASPAENGHKRGNSISKHARSNSQHHTRTSAHELAADQSRAGFTGEGLLASAKSGRSAEHRGRGVMDGSRARNGPMLDLSEQSKFVQGSLLDRVELEQGGSGPIIDREKREERNYKYGEGF